jgi:hypothetical protein
MIVAKFSSIRVPVLSLRAKISHSWLDHEVAMVPVELAVNRWQAGQWVHIAVRWGALYELALKLSDALPEFGAATLVDTIDAFGALGTPERHMLKERLAKLHAQLVDIEARQADYLRCLNSFWQAATKFFERTVDPMATGSDVSALWAVVRSTGSEFKCLFQDGTLPDGIILP